MIQKLFRFACVGALGFAIDAGTLLLLVRLLAIPPIPARVLSFVTAASVTFLLNQRYTFRFGREFSLQRWAFYLATTAFGAAINLGAYTIWIERHGTAPLQLAFGTAVGSLLAMTVNYAISSSLVFKPAKGPSLLE